MGGRSVGEKVDWWEVRLVGGGWIGGLGGWVCGWISK